MSRENVEIVRELFAAVARRDTETVMALYDRDVEWDGSRSRWAEVLPGEGRYTGHDGIRSFSRQYFEMWDGLEDSAEELIDAGDHGVISVVTSRGRGQRSGLDIAWSGHSAIWTVRDRRIVRVVWFPTREDALAAAGLAE